MGTTGFTILKREREKERERERERERTKFIGRSLDAVIGIWPATFCIATTLSGIKILVWKYHENNRELMM